MIDLKEKARDGRERALRVCQAKRRFSGTEMMEMASQEAQRAKTGVFVHTPRDDRPATPLILS